MATKTYAGVNVEVTEEGYLTDPTQWSKDIAAEIAKEEGIDLTDKHFEVFDYLRTQHEKGVQLTIRMVGKSGITDIKGLYTLFPGGPLKKSSRISGIPKPTSCV
ncbi:MAG TPA: TusE/DsrC/DsvC family sulfur relay protein [Bacteroides sp.]|nr:TusE/DsrC/DsvC family sulfur relay protein [Bacteroides sp.]